MGYVGSKKECGGSIEVAQWDMLAQREDVVAHLEDITGSVVAQITAKEPWCSPARNFVDVFKNIFIGALQSEFLHCPGSEDDSSPGSPARLDQRAKDTDYLHESAGAAAGIRCSVHPRITVVTCNKPSISKNGGPGRYGRLVNGFSLISFISGSVRSHPK